MADHQGAIRVVQHLDLRLDVMGTMPVGRELQATALEAHAVVVTDHPSCCLHRLSSRTPGFWQATKAELSSRAGFMNPVLYASR